jgi:hypothetical protein
LDVAKDV